MLGRLFMLFVMVPIVELMLLIQLGQWVGLMPTLGLVVVTGFVGAWLARREGFRAFTRFQETLAQGGIPADAALDGVAVLIGGAFLLTPGIVTDFVGFSLLIPPVRAVFKRRLVAAAKRRMEEGALRMEVYGFGPMAGPMSGPGAGGPEGPGYGQGGDADFRRPSSGNPREIVVPPPEEVD